MCVCEQTKNKVKDILMNHGIESLLNNDNELFDLDSIQYISIIVSLEQEFDIEIAEEHLLMKNEFSINDFYEMICISMPHI